MGGNDDDHVKKAATTAAAGGGGGGLVLEQAEDKSNVHDDVHKDEQSYDIFRDSPLRYLGYANEVGESFRYQYPKFVTPSYILAFGYCFADAMTSGYETYHQQQQPQQKQQKTKKKENDDVVVSTSPLFDATIATADTLIWQSLASVTIPGFTINMIVRACRFVVQQQQQSSSSLSQKITRSPMMTATVMKWFPTCVGLASIPLIIHPIDRMVDYLMDSTFRQIDWATLVYSKSSSSSSSEPKR